MFVFTELNHNMQGTFHLEEWRVLTGATMLFFVSMFVLYFLKILKGGTESQIETQNQKSMLDIEKLRDFYIQDIQDELERRSLAKKVIEMSDIGGVVLSPFISTKDVDYDNIQEKITKINEQRQREKEQREIEIENQEMLNLYREYKESIVI